MSGNLAINSYMKTIFNQASTGLDSSQSSIIATGITIPASKYNIYVYMFMFKNGVCAIKNYPSE